MGRFDEAKKAIDANIRQNGKQEITGQIMNAVLNEIVSAASDETKAVDTKLDDTAAELDGKITAASSSADSRITEEVAAINSRIDAEKSELTKKIADGSADLSAKITSEVNALNSKINDNTEILNEQINSTAEELQTNLDNKAAELDKKIGTETAALGTRVTEETARLDTKIDSEAERIDAKVDIQAKVLPEALASLAARVDALESSRGLLGNATAGNLDVSQLTKCLYPVVMKAHGVPAEANVPVNLPEGLPWDGIPAFIGQLYVNLDAAGGGLYYAVGTDSVNDWKQA